MNIHEAIEVIEDFKAMDDWTIVYCPPMHEALDVVVNEALKKPKLTWIPCSERLPVAYVEVLVCQLYEDVPFIAYINSKGRWRTDGFSISEDYEPIAWMPLPHPYKDDKK